MALKLVKGRSKRNLKVETVVSAVRSLIALEGEKAFIKECRALDLRLAALPELINLLKEHLDRKVAQATVPKAGAKMTAAAVKSAAPLAAHVKLAKRLRDRDCDDTTEC